MQNIYSKGMMTMHSIPEASPVSWPPLRVLKRSKSRSLVWTDLLVTQRRQNLSSLFFCACLLSGISLSYYAGRYYKGYFLNRENDNLPDHNPMFLEASSMRRQAVLVTSTNTKQSAAIITEEIRFDSEAFGQYEDTNMDLDQAEPTAITVMMDMEFVDEEFLLSKDAIQAAMLSVIWDASIKREIAMTAIHCQINVGIYCIAILKDGHQFWVKTLPSRGMLLLNFFAAVDGNVLDLIELIQHHFAIGNPRVRWNHILRGTRERLSRWRTYESDIADLFLDYKKFIFYKTPIGHAKSVFQEIDVWDFIDARVSHVIGYEQSLLEGTSEHAHAELYKPNRILFLDGVLQSTARGDEAYHEALVHPAMFSHANPKRVAIIGGGEGATLREVLKHKTVQSCKMIEIDAAMVQAAKEFLPALNNCSDFGTHESCFDDIRTELLCEDAFRWFLNRFGDKKTIEGEETFDLIIMDALDPEDKVEFAQGLYKDQTFWRSLQEALSDDGILVMQLGGSPTNSEFGEQFGAYSNRADLFDTIVKVGLSTLHLYEEAHCDFSHPWSFVIACKTSACSDYWYANEAEIGRKIHERIVHTKSGDLSLKYFDGSTMKRYQQPTRAWENVYCRADPQPQECKILDGMDGKASLLRNRLNENERLATEMERVVTTLRGVSVASKGDVLNRSSVVSGVSPVRDRHPKLFL